MCKRALSLIGILALVAFLLPAPVRAADFPATLEEDGVTFEKRGAGLFRWRGIFAVYDGALHMPTGLSRADFFEDVPKRLELIYRRAFSADQIVQGGNELLAENATKEELEPLRERIDRINAAYVDVQRGDRYTLTYVPDKGTTLRLNGKPLVTIPGHDFARVYFRIWLGESPISASFRDTLFGE
ncbi:MAG: chalcone isomerase family protein [Opitutales bacterium]|nr:chalcone isomerase family protein [Opitutales bacterium]